MMRNATVGLPEPTFQALDYLQEKGYIVTRAEFIRNLVLEGIAEKLNALPTLKRIDLKNKVDELHHKHIVLADNQEERLRLAGLFEVLKELI